MDILNTKNLTPGTFKRFAGRAKTDKVMPGLIPRDILQNNRTTQKEKQPHSLSGMVNGHKSSSSGSCNNVPKLSNPEASSSSTFSFKGDTVFDHPREPLSIWRKNICQRNRASPSPLSRSEMMVTSARRKGYNLEEKHKYSNILNFLSPKIYPKPTANSSSFLFSSNVRKVPPLLNGSKRPGQKSILPDLEKPGSSFSNNNSSIGSRNQYSLLLEQFSRKFDNPTRDLFQRKPIKQPVGFIDLTQRDGADKKEPKMDTVELTDDEDGATENGPKIPKSFAFLNKSNGGKIYISDDLDDEVDELERSIRKGSSSPFESDRESVTSPTNRSARKKETVAPVNSLLEDLNTNPMFKEEWLEATKKRYSLSQEERNRQIEIEMAK